MRKKKFFFAAISSMVLLNACHAGGNASASGTDSTQAKDPIEWERAYFLDEFGKQGNKAYERAVLPGSFSNSAATNEDLAVLMSVEKDSTIRIKLAEYGMYLAKDFMAEAKIRNSNGEIKHLHFLRFNADGTAFILPDCDPEITRALLSPGEKDVVIIEAEDYSGVHSSYLFSIPDGTSIANAIERLQD